MSVSICDEGLVLGAGSVLARMTGRAGGTPHLALEADRNRVLALLSVAYRRPVGADVLCHIEAASDHWRRGDKSLANLRLVFAGLKKLGDWTDSARLRFAEYCLDEGLSPYELMTELELDASVLRKYGYDPSELRDGRGRWAREVEGRSTRANIEQGGRIQVAANEPLKPDGTVEVPIEGIDPLDPAGLNNEPPSPEEQQAIVDTLNIIRGGTATDVKKLNAHPYLNLPHFMTGAVLPPSAAGYKSYNLRLGDAGPRGLARLVMDPAADRVYNTSNHYFSFYAVDISQHP